MLSGVLDPRDEKGSVLEMAQPKSASPSGDARSASSERILTVRSTRCGPRAAANWDGVSSFGSGLTSRPLIVDVALESFADGFTDDPGPGQCFDDLGIRGVDLTYVGSDQVG